MLQKIKLLGTYAFNDRGQTQYRVKTEEVEEVFFNTSLIKFVNVLKLDKKTVWKIQLMDEEVLFALPFKL